MGSTRLTQSAREVGRVPHGRTARETWVLLRALRCAWGMGQRLSMATRHEITRKYAKEYEPRFEEGQGSDARRARRGHGLVAGQCPAGGRGGVQAQGPGPGGPAQATGAHVRV